MDISRDQLIDKGLPLAALVVGALVLTFLVSRLLRRTYITNPRVAARQRTLLYAISSVLRYTIWIAALLIAITLFSDNASGTLLSLGTLAVVAGFAAQHGVKDFLAGTFLLLEGQYAVGDHIYVSENLQGTVEQFSLRTTTIRLEDGRRAVVRHDALNSFVVTDAAEAAAADDASTISPPAQA
jgi:small-conductance mechanosensitive channel